MNRIKHLIFLLLLASSLFSQQVLDFGKIDFISLERENEDVRIIKKVEVESEDNDGNKPYVECLLQGDNRTIEESGEREYRTEEEIAKMSNFLSVEKLDSISPNQWLELLRNKTFESGWETDFTMLTPSVVKVTQYNTTDDGTPLISLYNLCYLKIDEGKYVPLLMIMFPDTDYGNGYDYMAQTYISYIMLPIDGHLEILDHLRNHFINLDPDVEYTFVEGDLYNHNAILDINEFYIIRGTSDGREELTTNWGDPAGISGDHVDLSAHYIGARRGNKYSVYNVALRELPFGNIRSLKADDNGRMEVLVGNDMKFVENNQLVDEQNYISYPENVSEVVYTDSITINGDGKYELRCLYEHYTHEADGTEQATYYPLIDAKNEIDSILYMRRSLSTQYETSGEYLWVKKKSGKYNIAHYDIDSNKFEPLDILPNDVDYVDPDSFFLYNKGLMGYFVGVRIPKYKSLELTKFDFMRYQKTDGKCGWLDISSGAEYPDI